MDFDILKMTKNYPVWGFNANRKKNVMAAALFILSEVKAEVDLGGDLTTQQVNKIYNEGRATFKAYLDHNNIYSEGRMKMYDAVAIPKRMADVDKARLRHDKKWGVGV